MTTVYRRSLRASALACLACVPSLGAGLPGIAAAATHSRGSDDTVLAPAAGAACANTGLVPSASNLAAIATATLCLVNRARRQAGLAPLGEDAALDRAAQGHSAAMVADDYFDHVGPDGLSIGQRIRATGYVPPAAGGLLGENIAAGTGSAASAAATVAMWLRSPGHRANILDPSFTATGLGVSRGAPRLLGLRSGDTYTEDFA